MQEILTPDGNIKKGYDKETQSHVVHYHVPPYDLHFKQQPSDLKKQSPFHPGKEQAVSRLIMRLFGHGTSFSTLTSFTVYQQGKKIKDYLVLISKTVPGPTLQKTPGLNNFDPKRLSEVFLSIPLILPGDTREVNCIIEKTPNEKGKEIEQLVSIDSDVAWIKPVVNTSLNPLAPKFRCQLYTVLFSHFPNFTLHPEAVADFLRLKPGPLISGWLQEMIAWNQDNGSLFKRFEALPDFTPRFQFDKGTGAQILTQFFRLQSFLRNHPQKQNIPALDILRTIVSLNQDNTIDVGGFIYSEYLKAQDPRKGSPSQRVKEITGRDGSKSISMTLSNAAVFNKLPKATDPQTPYLPETALKEVSHLIAMNFDLIIFEQKENAPCKLHKGFLSDPPIDQETQEILLEALMVHTFDHLNLSYCTVLTHRHLKKLIAKSGPYLTHLDLRHCPQLTQKALPYILKCPRLEEFYLSHCEGVERFAVTQWIGKDLPMQFPKLKILHLSHCPSLTTFNIKAPELKVLKVDNNPRLTKRVLDAPGCKVITDDSQQLEKVAALEAQKLPKLIEEHAFGKNKWEQYFGEVGAQPPLPEDIGEILNSRCKIWPDKKMYETHLLTLIPQTVNGKPLTLKTLGELVQKPLQGPATKYHLFRLGAYQDPPNPVSHWTLLSRDVIPNSRNKRHAAQQELVPQYPGYEIPHILDATVSIFMEHVQSGTRLYPYEPYTFTCCQEKFNANWQLDVGGFAAGGLEVNCAPSDSEPEWTSGVGLSRMF